MITRGEVEGVKKKRAEGSSEKKRRERKKTTRMLSRTKDATNRFLLITRIRERPQDE